MERPTDRGRGRRLAVALLVALSATSVPAPSSGQDRAAADEAASAFVEPDHWAVAAARRLDALGLAPRGFDAGRRALTRGRLRAILAHGVRTADEAPPAIAALARAYLARFDEEFPSTSVATAERATPGAGDLQAEMRYERREDIVLAGVGNHNDASWTGVRPVADFAGSAATLRWAPSLGGHAAALVEPIVRQDSGWIARAHAVGMWRGVGVWAGRRAAGYATGAGGLVLGTTRAFTGGGVLSRRPFTLPGPLDAVGPVHAETFLVRMDRNARFEEPWFLAFRGTFSPHPRVTVGLTRGVLFGGEGNTGLSLRTVAYMMIGKHSGVQGEYDNQVFAVDARVRPPLPWLPLVAYIEWGMDDSAGAWKDVPAFVLGAEVPAVPGLPQLALALERTSFAESCCGNAIWYRNWSFRGGWTDAGDPLGYPLAGHGSEWRLSLRADPFDARVRGGLRLFLRDRGAENLFAPERTGGAIGGALTLEARLMATVDAFLTATVETDRDEPGQEDWERQSIETGLRVRLGPDPAPADGGAGGG